MGKKKTKDILNSAFLKMTVMQACFKRANSDREENVAYKCLWIVTSRQSSKLGSISLITGRCEG